MSFSFLNKLFEKYIDGGFDLQNGNELNIKKQDEFLFENNKNNLSEIISFLNSQEKVISIAGFQGEGKTIFLNYLPQLINSQTLIFRFNFFKASTLEDILINFFETFKQYHLSGKIRLSKVDFKDFSQKISYYIKNLNNPILIIFDSPENLETQENIKEIFSYINHILIYDNIKLIFSSRNFDLKNNLKFALTLRNIEFKAFSQEIGTKFLSKYGFSQETINKLQIKCQFHYLYLYLITVILNKTNISPEDFINKIETKEENFDNIILKNVLSLVSPTQINILNFLFIGRNGLTEKRILNYIEDARKEDLDYLLQCYFIQKSNNILFVKDYIKELFSDKIPNIYLVKYNKYYAEMYTNLLPKKPSERDILLSRQTIRNEISYHQNILNLLTKSSQLKSSKESGVSFVGYTPKIEKLKPKTQIDKPSFFQMSAKDKTEYKINVDILKIAQNARKNFNFDCAIQNYNDYLSKNTTSSVEIAEIYADLAFCYEKINQYKEAINFYLKSINIYRKLNDNKNGNEIAFCLAELYRKIYKDFEAKNLYLKILETQNQNSIELNIKTMLNLRDLSCDMQDAQLTAEYSQKLLDIAKICNDNSLVAQIYYKYAILLDDFSKIDEAIKYYLKSAQYKEDNKNLFEIYFNIGILYQEKEQPKEAMKYFEFAYKINDEKNYENSYYLYSKMANLYKISDFNKALELAQEALFNAEKSNDNFFITSAYINIGDICYLHKQNQKAFQMYLKAKKIASENSFSELKENIKDRLKDMKIRLGQEIYDKILKENNEQ